MILIFSLELDREISRSKNIALQVHWESMSLSPDLLPAPATFEQTVGISLFTSNQDMYHIFLRSDAMLTISLYHAGGVRCQSVEGTTSLRT